VNTIVADSLDYIASKLEEATKSSPNKLNAAIQELLQEIAKEHSAVIFNGNNYSEDWHKEAGNAACQTSRPRSRPFRPSPARRSVSMFENTASSPSARSKRAGTSTSNSTADDPTSSPPRPRTREDEDLSGRHALPDRAGQQCGRRQAAGGEPLDCMFAFVSEQIKALRDAVVALQETREHHAHGLLAEARHYCTEVLPAMLEVRKAADALEGVVADDLWPLPTYEEYALHQVSHWRTEVTTPAAVLHHGGCFL